MNAPDACVDRAARMASRPALGLAPGGCTSFDRVRGALVTVTAGRILLTEAGSAEDHLLVAGAVYRVTGNGRVVIEAIGPAGLTIDPAPGWGGRRATRRAIWRSLVR